MCVCVVRGLEEEGEAYKGGGGRRGLGWGGGGRGGLCGEGEEEAC